MARVGRWCAACARCSRRPTSRCRRLARRYALRLLEIRRLVAEDHDEYVRMRLLLWPDAGWEDLASEVPGMLANPDTPVFVAVRAGGGLCGFVEASIRPSA